MFQGKVYSAHNGKQCMISQQWYKYIILLQEVKILNSVLIYRVYKHKK